jgi:hypothetical protein
MDKNKRAMQREMSQLCKSMIGFAASKKFIFFYIHIHKYIFITILINTKNEKNTIVVTYIFISSLLLNM